jgi:tetratricopeptide (TPR) repeat protein
MTVIVLRFKPAALSIALLSAGTACTGGSDGTNLPDLPDGIQAVSLLGDSLSSSTPAPGAVERYEQARRAYEANPGDADALIWFGRRAAYTGEYREAVAIFTSGIEAFPDDARMYRHRGHRYITLRQFDLAIADLERAARLIEGTADEVEPDGLPNALNIPLTTLHSNIWYHLGLARYLNGDLEGALEAYRKCRAVERNDDGTVSSTHWLYMILRRLGREDEAAAVLEPVHPEMEIIENTSYYRLCLLYKGLLTPDDLPGEGLEGSANDALVYGIGNWHLYNGDREGAKDVYERIMESGGWASFGYLAAEADLHRLFGR